MLQFFDVKRSYRGDPILSIPTWELGEGVHWLEGANGSGKTTLLRMIAGLLPFEGDIRLNGLSLHRDPVDYRRAVSWADAEPLYPAFIRGGELLAFYAEARKAPQEQAAQLVARFSMQRYISTPVGGWSSGMVKKLSLVLAFIGRPSLIVLDEPLVTLDRESVSLLLGSIWEHRQNGTSFLLTSHQELDTGTLIVDSKTRIIDQMLKEIAG